MPDDLTSVKVATLVAEGFERDHLLELQEFLHRAGATNTAVSVAEQIPSEVGKAGWPVASITIEGADQTSFDALLLPGGTSADKLAQNRIAMDFVRSFLTASRPIGAIAEGIKLLVAANGIAGFRISAGRALKEPIQKAGGLWVDEPLVTDLYLTTVADSRLLDPFLEAFARSCFQYKISSGTSLHTD